MTISKRHEGLDFHTYSILYSAVMLCHTILYTFDGSVTINSSILLYIQPSIYQLINPSIHIISVHSSRHPFYPFIRWSLEQSKWWYLKNRIQKKKKNCACMFFKVAVQGHTRVFSKHWKLCEMTQCPYIRLLTKHTHFVKKSIRIPICLLFMGTHSLNWLIKHMRT